ncbi:MAG: hypothetical protein IIC82_00005, partial [Chloroflexi bacterium]|nr:hypothetical protein [Chloroflexota bacterium]
IVRAPEGDVDYPDLITFKGREEAERGLVLETTPASVLLRLPREARAPVGVTAVSTTQPGGVSGKVIRKGKPLPGCEVRITGLERSTFLVFESLRGRRFEQRVVTDEHGVFVTQLQTLALLALYFLDVRGERGAMVKSITTTNMLYRLGEQYDVPVFETPVGFKHIGPIMMRENAILGGEESGGYGFRGHIPERDGILSGLYILSMMVKLNMRPSELIEYLYSKVGPHHYERIDITFDPADRQAVMDRLQASTPKRLGGSPVKNVDTMDGFRYQLDDGSWSLIRFSGTEPLLRIYCETSSPERVRVLLAETRQLTGV